MVLPRFIDSALAGRPLVVHDDGHQVRCFAHVLDVVRAVMELMETEAAVACVFNVGSDQPISILQLAKRVIETINPKLQVAFQSYADAYDRDFEDVRSRIPDLSRLRSVTGFKPEFDLDTVIRDVIEETRARQRRM
jgi:UDP-glucose 4-epimerase